ncbi:MAG: TetR/AcrR family transcriptional regulator [Methanoregula sp.]|jgi:AcrR family transcriptional regulator|nr:TetR/AcrR family transcriptional regulator [Methanoregula sp.]
MIVADRKQRKKEQRRTEIVDAAEKLFYKKGFDNVTMDEIADAVEFSKGSLYVYFKNKDSLFFAIVARMHREYFRQFRELLDENASGGEQIRTMIRHLVEYTKDHQEYNDMACTIGPLIWSRMDTEYEQVLAENSMDYNLWLNDAINKGIADGSIRNDLNPALFGFYISLISISVVSPSPLWKKGFELAGVGYDEFVDNFQKFIDPSINNCKTEGPTKKHPAGKSG